MVNEGRRGIDGVVEVFRADSPLDDVSRVDSRVGELGLLKLAMGNGVPDSLGGTKRRTAVAKLSGGRWTPSYGSVSPQYAVNHRGRIPERRGGSC